MKNPKDILIPIDQKWQSLDIEMDRMYVQCLKKVCI